MQLAHKIRIFLFLALVTFMCYRHIFPGSIIRKEPFHPSASHAALPYGCLNVRCILEHDPWASKRFNASIPLFLSASDSEFRSHVREIKKPLVADTLARLTRNQTALRSLHAGNCAVVGNSSNLLGSAYGQFIDGHDVVIRMNNAPVQPYTEDVGRKTTFSINYATKTSLGYYDADTVNIMRGLHKKGEEYFITDYADLLDNILSEMDNIHQLALRFDYVVLWHPKFVNYVIKQWYEEQFIDNAPSSGFYATIFALHICDQVDLFGFGANHFGAWGHYFDQEDNKTKPDQHKPDYQEKLLATLQSKQLITVYRGIPK